ncbi:DUF481 domain-containing protein [Carboxylicivirga sp. M1479]|uniref:DUF481 domain-containing protein n=1 Tax=Carboxylicivirga sp. M1479 TaxID=2594476 RepID=UPI0011778EB6|nr:DUF481 domain-containing protein [Carboxylicivirga sp. M1479]TRX72050.1 DUF481 domain-containing protein [Carboxylicivirga sp. M1479]
MKKLFHLILFFLISATAYSQVDKITFNNDDSVIGEIKSMKNGVLSIETDYSDADFTIEWSGIKTIISESYFLITVSDGRRFNGQIATNDNGLIDMITDDEGTITVYADDIVHLESVDKGFWSQVYASIDVGFDITKANNLRQLTSRSNVGYIAERWSTDMFYNGLNSEQDSVAPVKRDDAGIDFKYYFQRKWFSVISSTFLSNTEQKLDLRTNGKLGIGTYLLQTNAVYWNLSTGASFNMEQYEDPSTDRDSWEGYVSSELNMFDTGDLSLTAKAGVYPSITEKSRIRTDFSFDVKYDLPRDFYVRMGATLNYDNQPVEGASESDYIFSTGFGWEL